MDAAAFEQDVLAEPAALERLAGAPDPREGLGSLHGRRVVVIGMGSSRFAALPAAARLRTQGIDAWAELASTRLPLPPARDVLAIGVSASGASPETLTALERHRGVSRTVAITNVADSPLGALADVVLPLDVGPERGGVACRSFQATVAVLHRLCGVPADALRRAAAAQATLLGAREAWLEELLDCLDGAHTTYVLAGEERISSALQSALMLREGPRVAAVGCETGDWSHVDVYLSKHRGYRAVLLPGSSYDREARAWLRERGCTVVAVGAEVADSALQIGYPDAADPVVASLVETSVLELAAAVWWQRRVAAGTMP